MSEKDPTREFRKLCSSCAQTGFTCWLRDAARNLEREAQAGQIDTRDALSEIEQMRDIARKLDCPDVNKIHPIFPGT